MAGSRLYTVSSGLNPSLSRCHSVLSPPASYLSSLLSSVLARFPLAMAQVPTGSPRLTSSATTVERQQFFPKSSDKNPRPTLIGPD